MKKIAVFALAALVATYCFISCTQPTSNNNSKGDDSASEISDDSPVISTLSGTVTITAEAEAILGDEILASYSGSEAVNFQWSKDGIAIPGATLATYTPLEPGVYTVTISIDGYESKTSEPVTVNPKNAVPGTITISPDANIVVGSLLTATYTGSETVSFQWSKDGIAIPGATGATYSPLELGVYTVTVNADRYNGRTSNAVTVSVLLVLQKTDLLVINTEWTYNGSPQGVTIVYSNYSFTVGAIGTVAVYYSGKDGTVYAESTQAPTNAGSYDILVSTTGGSLYEPFPKTAIGVLTIDKAPGGIVSAPTLASKTYNSITLNTVSAPSTGQLVQYAKNTIDTPPSSPSEWQDGLTFSGLDPLTEYYLFARSNENNNYDTGVPSTRLAIVTTGTLANTIFTSRSNFKLAWIPDGSFSMGSPPSENGRQPDENPPHSVTLHSGFFMGVYQVTQKQYFDLMGGGPMDTYQAAIGAGLADYGRGDDFPMYYVNWYDALVFCNRLSMAEGLTPAYSIGGSTDPADWGTVPIIFDPTWNAVEIVSGSTGYRLPTEAQWEYACRAETTTAFNDGHSDDYSADITAVELLGWYNSNSGSKTHEAGQKAKNAWELYDMHGNVSDWCWDWYGSMYYSSSPSSDDPTGPLSGSGRLARGGRWGSTAQYARSAYRGFSGPDKQSNEIGLRLVRP